MTPGGARVEFVTRSERETEALAARLAKLLRAGDTLALIGDLGAGKTRFVRGLAAGLGHDPRRVSSPTFVVAHEHVTAGAITLIHVDAYRVSGPIDLDQLAADLGVEESEASEAVVAVEWPERAPALLERPSVDVRLEHRGLRERRIRVATRDDRAASLART